MSIVGEGLMSSSNKKCTNTSRGINTEILTHLLKVVTIGENGVTENDILVHDATTEDPTLHLKLALMDGPDMPIAMGVIRAVPTECYDEAVHNQIKEVQEKSKCHTFDELLDTLEQWDM